MPVFRCTVALTYPPDFQRTLWTLRRRTQIDPIAFIEELGRSPDDVVPFSLAGRPAFLLKHPDLAEAVLVTHQHKFVKSYGLQRAARLLGNGLLTAEGLCHRHRRTLTQPAFHRQLLERHAEVMVAHAIEVRDRWSNARTLDVASEASALTFTIVGRTLFGVDVESLSEEVRQALKTASDALDPLVTLLAPARRVRPQRERLLEIIDDLVVRRRNQQDHGDGNSPPDLISILLASEDAGSPMVSDQLRDDALTVLLAGHDTIANALVWTWILLAQHPGAQSQLEKEVDAVLSRRSATASDVTALRFTRAVLAESLRLRPPAWVLARTALMEHELSGIPIPAGSLLLISQHVMHRDPRFFSNPSVFDPARWLDEQPTERPRLAYLPFGAGPRACIGEGFAWMEGVLLLATFAQRWRLRLTENGEPIAPCPKITLRPPPGIRMAAQERAL
jgi:cytochrome P450